MSDELEKTAEKTEPRAVQVDELCYIAACQYIVEVVETCPGERELVDMQDFGCDKKCCVGNEVNCWMEFFERKAI